MRLACAKLPAGPLVLSLLIAAPVAAQTPTVTVGALVYAQYLYQLKDTAEHRNNFDVTRAYLNVLGDFGHGIKGRVTPDIYRNAEGSLGFRLKYAFATWTPEKSPLTFKFGQIHTPWLNWEEQVWDYRMQGSMAMERGGYMSSSDLGAGIDGAWAADRFNFQVGFYNGESFDKAPGDRRKDFMARASFRLARSNEPGQAGGLRATAYAHYGKPTGGGQRQRYIGMLSYRSKLFTLAVEFARTRDSVTDPISTLKRGRILSTFGVLRSKNAKLQAIGRFDSTDPNLDVDRDASIRLIGGVAYQWSANLRALADIDHVIHQGTVTPFEDAVRSKALFQIQLSF